MGPGLYEGMTRIEVPHDPNYHLMTDLANQAIKWTNYQKSLTPDKPFFTYFARRHPRTASCAEGMDRQVQG